MEKIACILINFNQDALTLDCIQSINQGTVLPDIFVVDNGSKQINRPAFESIENVRLIENHANLGFAGGNNIGAAKALEGDYDYILLLNNDTVIDKAMIAQLLEHANEETITTAKMYYADQPDVLWFAGGWIDKNKGLACHFGKDEKDTGQYDDGRQITFITGCCMLIHRKIIEKIGLFDDDLFLYCEDMEFCLKAGQNGITLLYVPTAKLWHKVGSSSGGHYSPAAVYYCTRNRFALLKKYPFPWRAKIYTCVTRAFRLLFSLFKYNADRMIWRGFWDYSKGQMGKVEIVDTSSSHKKVEK